MLKKVYFKLRSEGPGGLARLGWQFLFPGRLDYLDNCRTVFEAGTGIEIGGPSQIFGSRGIVPVYPLARKIDNVNFSHDTVWEGAIDEGSSFLFNKRAAPGRQYVGEASRLEFIADESYDYVLSSHCIEHLANPLQGLSEWMRVLREEGLLVLVVPHKDGTFDHRRPVTPLQHLIEDYDNGTDEGDLTHLEEILELHDLSRDPGAGDFQSFRERSQNNVENRCLHQHVFDANLAVEVVNHMGLQILAVELFKPYHIVIVARKLTRTQVVNNTPFRKTGGAPRYHSPFPSDRVDAAQPARPGA